MVVFRTLFYLTVRRKKVKLLPLFKHVLLNSSIPTENEAKIKVIDH